MCGRSVIWQLGNWPAPSTYPCCVPLSEESIIFQLTQWRYQHVFLGFFFLQSVCLFVSFLRFYFVGWQWKDYYIHCLVISPLEPDYVGNFTGTGSKYLRMESSTGRLVITTISTGWRLHLHRQLNWQYTQSSDDTMRGGFPWLTSTVYSCGIASTVTTKKNEPPSRGISRWRRMDNIRSYLL